MTLTSGDFFILRTSRLSEEHFLEIFRSADRSRLLMSDELASIIKVASSGLHATIQRETRSGTDARLSEKTETSALRTILRASTRATPFGLSSTSSLGTIGSADKLSIGHDNSFFGNTELSGEAISALINHINDINIRRRSAYIVLNPITYSVGDRIRYIVADKDKSGTYRYCEKIASNFDRTLFEFLQERRRLLELDKFFEYKAPPQPNYVEEMLAGGLLVPELALPMHRRDGLAFLTSYLRNNHPELDLELTTLDTLATRLTGAKGFSLTELEAVEHAVTATKEKIGLERRDSNRSPFLIDATRKMNSCQLSRKTADSLVWAARTLMLKTMRPTLLHEKLARKISERFGEEPVPIGYLADPKYGITFDPGSLADLPVAEASKWYETELSAFLVGEMVDCAGSINRWSIAPVRSILSALTEL